MKWNYKANEIQASTIQAPFPNQIKIKFPAAFRPVA